MSAPTLFRLALGPAMDRLPPAVRAVHDRAGRSVLTGRASVAVKPGWLPWLICAALGLPAAGTEVPVRIVFESQPDEDRWDRRFGSRRYVSRYTAGPQPGRVVERMGIVTGHFALTAHPDRLCLTLVRCVVLGVPVPSWLSPRCQAEETEADGAFVFDVPIDMPWLGRIIRYRGVMVPEASG